MWVQMGWKDKRPAGQAIEAPGFSATSTYMQEHMTHIYMQQHMMPATAMPATGASTQQFGKRAQEQADDRSMSCLCNISLRMLD